MGRRLVAIGACMAVWATLLIPTAASAHQSIRLGRYNCFEYTPDGVPLATGHQLRIRSGTGYAFVTPNGRLRRGGFAHNGENVNFTSGYLDRNGWDGFHSIDGSRNHGIRMVRETRTGFRVLYCSNPA